MSWRRLKLKTLNSWGVGQFLALQNHIHSFRQESAYCQWTPNQVVLESKEKVKRLINWKSKDVAIQMWSLWEGGNGGRDGIVGKTGDWLYSQDHLTSGGYRLLNHLLNYFLSVEQESLEKGEGFMPEATFSFLFFLGPVCGWTRWGNKENGDFLV